MHIYFPSHDEHDAIAVHAINTSSGEGKTPAVKSFTTPSGSSMNMAQDSYTFSPDKEGSAMLSIGSDGKISLTGKTIKIITQQEFTVGEDIGEDGVQPVPLINAEAKESFTLEIGESGDTKIALTENLEILAAFIFQNAEKETVPSPSANEIYAMISVNDGDILNAANEGAINKLGELANKRAEANAKVRDGIWGIIGTVAIVGLIACTGGVASVVVAGVIAVTAANDIMINAAKIDQGLKDIDKANKGDTSKTENLLQNFLGLSDEAYATFDFVNSFIFDVVTMTSLNVNVSKLFDAKKLGCFARFLGQTFTMATVQTGKATLDSYAQLGKVDLKTFGINLMVSLPSSILGNFTGRAASTWLVGKGYISSVYAQIGVRATVGGVTAGTMDTAIRKLFQLEEYLTWRQNVAMYGSSIAISDLVMVALLVFEPINAATGGFLTKEIDLVIPNIRNPIKLERNYDSSDRCQGVLGKGWFFPYESKLAYDENNYIYVRVPNGDRLCFLNRNGIFREREKETGRYNLQYDMQQGCWKLTDILKHQDYIYDGSGRLEMILDQNAQKTYFYYHQGILSSMVTPLGHKVSFEFQDNKLMKVSDETGRFTEYYYEKEMLVKVVNTDHGITKYEYSKEGYLTRAIDPTGVTYLANEYDRNGRTVRQVLDNGEWCQLEYLDEKRQTVLSTKEGKTLYEYNKSFLPISIKYQDETEQKFVYDEKDRCICKVDRRGNAHSFKYDENSHVVEEVYQGGLCVNHRYDTHGNLVETQDNEGRIFRYEYDDCHNLIKEQQKSGESPEQWITITYSFDSLGRLVGKTSPTGSMITYRYESNSGKPVRILYPDGTEITREYDAMERMMWEADSCGLTEYGYNADSYVTMIRDGEGNETRDLYDSMGRLLFHYSPKAWKSEKKNRIEYRYDFMAHLDHTIYPDGSHEKKVLDWEGNVLKKIHPNSYQEDSQDGEGEIYEYDCNKQLSHIHYPDGGTERFFYDAEGNCVKHILPEDYNSSEDDGQGFGYEYDAENRLCRVFAPDGTIEASYTYDLRGNCIRSQDAEGKVQIYWYDLADRMLQKAEQTEEKEGQILYRKTTYRYDGEGNCIEERRYGGSWHLINQEGTEKLELAGGGTDLILSFTYDTRNRLIQVEDGTGACTRYAYDCRGNRIMEEQRINAEVTKKIKYQYDKAGRLKEKQEFLDSGLRTETKRKIIPAITTYMRDENGNIVKITTPEGYQIFREYDSRDRLTCETVEDKKHGISRSVQVRYDMAGNIVSLCRKGADTQAYEVQYKYDLKDRLVHANEMGNAVFSYDYDQNDRVVGEVLPTMEGQELRKYVYHYNQRGQLEETINPYGIPEEKKSYDKMGNCITQCLADGEVISTSYNIEGQAVRTNTGKSSQTYCRNSRGQIIGIIDGNQNQTQYRLDGWGKILEIQKADGGTEGYTYDYAGNITSTVDANGNIITYRYNSQGKVCEITDQEGNQEQFWYDLEGRVHLTIDRLGNQIETVYNVDSNPVMERVSNGRGEWRINRTWKYDSLGNLIQSYGGGITYQYIHRPDGKLIKKSTQGRTLFTCTYHPDGNLRTLTDFTGTTMFYTYDLTGNLKSIVAGDGTELIRYHYTSGGKIQEILHHNGVQTAYSYDTEGNISGLVTKARAGKLLCDLHYEYDCNGNRTVKRGSMVLPEEGGLNQLKSVDYGYGYDSVGQLILEQRDKEEIRYQYDACGNRLAKVTKDQTEHSCYNQKNQLVERRDSQGTAAYQYDLQGNLTKEITQEGIRYYTYDGLNRAISVSTPEGMIQENTYDGEGLRSELQEKGTKSSFLFFNGEIIAELNANDQLRTQYIRGRGVAALGFEGEYYGSHRDEQGSICWLSGEQGQVESTYEYDAFGVVKKQQGNLPNRLLYTGEQYDQETQQYYVRARYYNPVIGRFTQEDTYRGDGLNLYAYCHNNPVMYYDPSGHAYNWGNKEENAKNQNATGENGDTKTGNWNKGSFDSAEDSLNKHFRKHGEEVGAKTLGEYLRKAVEYARTAKKGSTKSTISGEVEGVIRYKKNGKYIDLAPDGSIVSFGKQ